MNECVCVCKRERERERCSGKGQASFLNVFTSLNKQKVFYFFGLYGHEGITRWDTANPC